MHASRGRGELVAAGSPHWKTPASDAGGRAKRPMSRSLAGGRADDRQGNIGRAGRLKKRCGRGWTAGRAARSERPQTLRCCRPAGRASPVAGAVRVRDGCPTQRGVGAIGLLVGHCAHSSRGRRCREGRRGGNGPPSSGTFRPERGRRQLGWQARTSGQNPVRGVHEVRDERFACLRRAATDA